MALVGARTAGGLDAGGVLLRGGGQGHLLELDAPVLGVVAHLLLQDVGLRLASADRAGDLDVPADRGALRRRPGGLGHGHRRLGGRVGGVLLGVRQLVEATHELVLADGVEQLSDAAHGDPPDPLKYSGLIA